MFINLRMMILELQHNWLNYSNGILIFSWVILSQVVSESCLSYVIVYILCVASPVRIILEIDQFHP